MLPPEAKLAIELGVCGGEHAAVTGGEQFAGMKREAGHIRMRLADPFPAFVQTNLAAYSAGGILDDRKVVLASNGLLRSKYWVNFSTTAPSPNARG